MRVCFKPFQTLRQLLSKPKDDVPDIQKSSMVYKIPCSVCPMVYIGQTGHRLNQRLCEHERAVKTADFNPSALAEHAWSAGHAVDWENVSIVNRCPDYHSRIVSEAIAIRTTSNTLNSGSLPVVYDNLL